jgi:hypothetical protein
MSFLLVVEKAIGEIIARLVVARDPCSQPPVFRGVFAASANQVF